MSEASVPELPPQVDLAAEGGLVCEGCSKAFKNKAGLGAHRLVCKGKPAEQGEQASQASPNKQAKERAPKVPSTPSKGRRHDASGLLGAAWGGFARLVPSPAAQRAMAWQAPSAGKTLDRALEGSFIDRQVLQRIAGAESKYKPLTSLLALPVLVALAERNPAMLPVLYGPLRMTLEDNLESILETAAEAKRRQERLAQKAADAGIDLTVTDEQGESVELIDQLIADLLGTNASQAPA